MKFASRVALYEPNGEFIKYLNGHSGYSFSQTINDVSALVLNYPRLGGDYDIVDRPFEAAVQTAMPDGTWVEQPNQRYVRQSWEDDVSKREADVMGANLPGIATVLSYAKVLSIGLVPSLVADKYDVEGKRKFLSASPGTILTSVLNENREFDADIAKSISFGFTGSRDSANVVWDRRVTIYYEPGLSLLDILQNLSDAGLVDWWFEGRELKVYNAESRLAPTRSDVILDYGRATGNSEAPARGTIEGVKHIAVLRGEEDQLWLERNSDAPSPWGKNLAYINQGGVSDEGTARIMIQGELAAGAQERIQYTRKHDLVDMQMYPLVDYQAGTFIRVRNRSNAYEEMRVIQVSIDVTDADVYSASFTLNDKFESQQLRQAKRMKGIVRGGVGDGGVGTQPIRPEGGRRRPQTPEGFVVASEVFLNNEGRHVAVALGSVFAPTVGVDGYEIQIERVELWGGRAAEDTYRLLASGDPSAPSVAHSPLPPGELWAFKMRVVAENGVASSFTEVQTITLAADVTPPPVPSALELSSKYMTVRGDWDKLGANGETMPPDYSHNEVACGPDPLPTEIRERLDLVRSMFISDETVSGEPFFARHRTVDQAGNASAWSAVRQITPESLVNEQSLEAAFRQTNSTIAQGLREADEALAKFSNEWDEEWGANAERIAELRRAQEALEKAWEDFDGFDPSEINKAIADIDRELTDLNTNVLPGIYDGTRISDNAISTSHIAANAIDADQIRANAITSDKIRTNAITAIKIAANAIESDKIAANAITSVKIAADAVTAREINVDSLGANTAFIDLLDTNLINARLLNAESARITGNAIVNGTLTAAKLVIGEPSNMIMDSLFNTEWWRISGNAEPLLVDNDRTLTFTGPGEVFTQQFDAIAGAEYVLQFDAWRSGSDTNDDYRAWIRAVNENGSYAGSAGVTLTQYASENRETFSIEFAIPPRSGGVSRWEVNWRVTTLSSDYLRIVAPTLRRRAGGEVIIDGAISADKLAANSVTTRALVAGSVTTNVIASNAITTDKIDAGAITAELIRAGAVTGEKISGTAIDGKTITGTTIVGGTITSNVNIAGEIRAGNRFTAGSGNGGVIIRSGSDANGIIVGWDASGSVSLRLGGRENYFAGDVVAQSAQLVGRLSVGTSTSAEGGLRPVGSRIRIEGRLPAVDGSRDMIVQGASSSYRTNWEIIEWTVNYDNPSPTGSRRVVAGVNINRFNSDGNVNVNVGTRTTTGFTAVTQPMFTAGGASFWIHYIALWV